MNDPAARLSPTLHKKKRAHKHLQPFLAGAFGGMFPTWLRIAIDLTQHGKKIFEAVDVSLLAGVILFAILGGIVVLFWGEQDLRKACNLGVALPSLLTILASTASAPSAFEPVTLFQSIVNANGNINAPGRHLELLLPSSESESDLLTVTFEREAAADTTDEGKMGQLISVPDDAVRVQVSTAVGDSKSIAIPKIPGATIVMNLTLQKKPGYGFMYAVGIHSKPFVLALASQVVRSFALSEIVVSSSCSVITLKNVTGSNAFLTGLRLWDGRSLDIRLTSSEPVSVGAVADIYVGPNCMLPINTGLRSQIIIDDPNGADPRGGVVTLSDSAGTVDSRPYGPASRSRSPRPRKKSP